MICPNCRQETIPGLFCHACDSYLPKAGAGVKAGVSRRFAAVVLDGITAWIIFLVIIAISAGIGFQGSGGAGIGTFVLAVIAYTVFAFWFLAQGKTPGKWLVGIRAADKRNGDNPGLGRMLVREILGKFVSGLFLGIGYLWAVFDKDTQAWHDKIAGTVVLRRSAPIAVPTASIQPQQRHAAASMSATAELSSTLQPPILFCGNCGAKIEAGSRFCESCGASLS